MKRKLPPDAFDYYVSLGIARSYLAVADHYGVSKPAVVALAKRENWQQRLTQIEEKARERADERLTDTIAQMRERHLQTIRAIQGRAVKALREFPLTSGMEAVKAAELAIKLERLVAGEASERTELDVAAVTREEMRRLLTVEALPQAASDDADGDW